MPAKVHYELDTRRLDSILKKLPGRTEDNNRAIGFRVEAGTKLKSPRDTGANAASVYTDCGGEIHGDPGNNPFPRPQGHDAHVGPSMDYSLHLELGTRRMAARPYLLPALREVENALAAQWENIADG